VRARPELPFAADERQMLENWLEFHRWTLEWKCDGLSPERLVERSCPPSSLSLLGLVRHMAEVERSWFRRILADEDVTGIYYTQADVDAGREPPFDDADPANAATDFATWHGEIEQARRNCATVGSLDSVGKRQRDGEDVTLRWILVHMIEEYARHNGHADLIRERIDGAVGD
jgi:hypothetical protein